jgi:hypothetical protein
VTTEDDDGLKEFGIDGAERREVAAPPIPAPVADASDRGDITIYVDPVRGDDSNPGTFELPVKTFAAANKAAPAVVRGSLRIQLAAGAYTLEDGKKRTHGKRRRR